MTEFQELVKDAPKFASMEHGELVIYAYAMYAAGAKMDAEIAKLRELARGLGQCAQGVDCEDCLLHDMSEPDHCREERLSRDLGIEA